MKRSFEQALLGESSTTNHDMSSSSDHAQEADTTTNSSSITTTTTTLNPTTVVNNRPQQASPNETSSLTTTQPPSSHQQQAFSDPYHRITPLMTSIGSPHHSNHVMIQQQLPQTQQTQPSQQMPSSTIHSHSSMLHRLAIHNATMNTVNAIQQRSIPHSIPSSSQHSMPSSSPPQQHQQHNQHNQQQQTSHGIMTSNHSSPPSKKLKSQTSSPTNPSQALPPNLPNLLPNLMGNSLPPLSNFLFTPPPFLQAVSRSRSNSSSSTNSTTPNSSQPIHSSSSSQLIHSSSPRNRSNSTNLLPSNGVINSSNMVINSSNMMINSSTQSFNNTLSNPSTVVVPSGIPVNSSQNSSKSHPITSTGPLPPSQDTRSQKLKDTWVEVYKSLKKLEAFVSQKTTQSCTRPWENNEHVTLFTIIYDLCILPDSVYYEDQLYILYSIYIKKYLQTTIVPCLKDKHSEDLLNEIVFIWGNFRDIFVKFCSYIFKYLDQFYVVSNSKRTLRSEAFYSFKTVVFDGMKTTLRQIILDKIDQDRKNFNSDTSFYLSQRHLLRQTLELFIELDHSNFVPIPDYVSQPQRESIGGNITNISSSSNLSVLNSHLNSHTNCHLHCEEYVQDFEKFAEKETREFYHKIAEDWIEKYNLTEYLMRAEDCIQQEQSRIYAIFPTHFSQNKLMKIVDLELLKNKEQRLLEMSGSGVKILIRDEKMEDLKRLYRLMNRVEGGLEPIAELFKEYLIFVGNELFSKHERATLEMIKGVQSNMSSSSSSISTSITTSSSSFTTSSSIATTSSSSSSSVTTSSSITTTTNSSNSSSMDTSPPETNTKSSSDPLNNIIESSIISNEVYTKCVRYLIEYYVIELMELHKKMKNIVNGPFCRNVIFHKAMSEGFKQFVNKNISLGQFEIRVVQLFAYYTDDILRKKTDDNLDLIVDFIQFFSDRDIFIEEYRKLFAVRLLVTDYQELEERMMISKLKYHYRGVADIYKLEKMLADKTMTNDMRQDFQNYISLNNLHLPYEVNVTVLTMGMWPLKAKEYMQLPKEIADSQMLFKQFYDSRNGKRVLKWVYSKSMVQLLAHYAKGNHLLELTTLQASILLLFNDNSSLTLKQIEELTGLSYDNIAIHSQQQQQASSTIRPFGAAASNSESQSSYSSDIDLKQAIASLTTEKLPLLIRTNNASSSGESSIVLTLNEAFHNRLHKIKVPLPRVTQKDIQSTQSSVSTDRTYILDACVVRVMKTRKSMNIQSLFNEVVTQLIPIFTPDVKQIKKRIESLIERDFLKRDEVNNTIIHYVA
ncbi:hypothetical protein C9374_008147 [Naegleria lovaniensis]|uniref:Cullin family profile domain-containing protein n=1 Tax=Naegleria lovaniensis TaxID=51637 RepID=A0AA88KI47_NAELO|nr:uncharacterized protein C9374_008147 [Naegleria lovaniensis]KAG2378508.1 hypothetical protein C9374_008147 [Naegleria lovaniensis]